MLRRLATEPLVQFLLGGAALFALDAGLSARRGPGDAVIVVSAADRARLQAQTSDGGLPPAIDQFVREEVLVREARALGLDRDDPQLRSRLAQKMEFVLSEGAEVQQPTPAEVRAAFDANPERYRSAPTIDLTQLFFSHAVRGGNTLRDATLALQAPEAAASDPSYIPRELASKSALDLTSQFGASFAGQVLSLPAGVWQGPIPSSLGLHLVKVTARHPGQVPPFSEAAAQVADDLLELRRREAEAAAFERLRARYRVEGAAAR